MSGKKIAYLVGGIAILMFGLAYASVPLYQLFCQLTGYGGTPKIVVEHFGSMEMQSIIINFEASTMPNLSWDFHPLQAQIEARIGEPILAFYRVTNNSTEDIIGVATYNILPAESSIYFNKIQCFCFDEQKLEANETIDMPVLFYIDPEILEDPQCNGINKITLAYTFFRH